MEQTRDAVSTLLVDTAGSGRRCGIGWWTVWGTGASNGVIFRRTTVTHSRVVDNETIVE